MAGRSNVANAHGVASGVSIRVRPSWPDDPLPSNRRCFHRCFNPRPAFMAGRSKRPASTSLRVRCFNPRPAFMAGRSQVAKMLTITEEFQSASGLHGRTIPPGPDAALVEDVSIRVRPSWPDDHLADKVDSRERELFQSASGLHGRTIRSTPRGTAASKLFQSASGLHGRTIILNLSNSGGVTEFQSASGLHGRTIQRSISILRYRACFNPRPAFMAGRSSIRARCRGKELVSIRVRPSWPDDPWAEKYDPSVYAGFNPRPAFMAGRSLPCCHHQ